MSAVIRVELPSGGELEIVRRRFGAGGEEALRVVIVAGIRGDAPEGIRVAHKVACALEAIEDRLMGTVDIYPCANPLAAHRGHRLWPFFDVDLNRMFPGRSDGHPPDRVADALFNDVRGADQVVELRGARAAFSEVPHAQVRHRDEAAAELAAFANVRLVWARRPGPAAAGTFAHQFPGAIVLEGGTGNRLRPGIGETLAEGVLSLICRVGILKEEDLPFHWAGLSRPARVSDEQVLRHRAQTGGLFLPLVEIWASVVAGDLLGEVIDPSNGEIREEIRCTADGHIMAMRDHPVVYPGSMVARVVVA
jgi:predicted deacylase